MHPSRTRDHSISLRRQVIAPLVCPPDVSVNMTSLRSYTIKPNATNVKLHVYTARDVLDGECQVLHTSRAFIYTKMLEDALQTAIHKTPIPMRLHRQHLSIDLLAN